MVYIYVVISNNAFQINSRERPEIFSFFWTSLVKFENFVVAMHYSVRVYDSYFSVISRSGWEEEREGSIIWEFSNRFSGCGRHRDQTEVSYQRLSSPRIHLVQGRPQTATHQRVRPLLHGRRLYAVHPHHLQWPRRTVLPQGQSSHTLTDHISKKSFLS